MSFYGWVISIAVFGLVGWETVRGWRTGRIDYRALKGDREEAPVAYWFVMTVNVILLVAVLLAMLGIYGQPF